MRMLMRGEWYRFWRSGLFRMALVASLLAGAVFGFTVIPSGPLDCGCFDDMFIVPLFVLSGIFFSLTTGREYGDGTIRNKIIQGKTRLAIYCSKLCVNVMTNLLFTGLFLVGFSLIALRPLLPHIDGDILLRAALSFLMMNGTWAVLFTVVSLSVSNREWGSILNLSLIVIIMFGAYQLEFSLGQPEVIRTEAYEDVQMTPEEVAQVQENTFQGSYSTNTDDTGLVTFFKYVVTEEHEMPNPNYIRGVPRHIAQLLDNTLPHGQVNQYVSYLQACLYTDDPCSLDPGPIVWFPLDSLGLMAVLAVGGLLLFRKKEFK